MILSPANSAAEELMLDMPCMNGWSMHFVISVALAHEITS
jgi:hypothetical protein